MNVDEAQKILSTVKKRKLAKGIDLTVSVRGAEALHMIMFSLLVLYVVLLIQCMLHFPSLLLLIPLTAVFVSAILACTMFHKKIASVREFMMMKRIYSLDEIEK